MGFSLDRHSVELVQRQRHEQLDACLQLPTGVAECLPALIIRALDRSRVRYTQCAVIGLPGQTGHTSPAA
jgi:hypothetical protein